MADAKWYEKPTASPGDVTSADRLLLYDTEAGTTKNVTVAALISGAVRIGTVLPASGDYIGQPFILIS